jgi:ferredoxin
MWKGIEIKVDSKSIVTDGSEKSVNLRKELQKNKIEVYSLLGKFNNCGGSGICGKCAVKVIDGAKNISPPSKNELNTLKGKDARLSCCSRVSGPISIKCLKP